MSEPGTRRGPDGPETRRKVRLLSTFVLLMLAVLLATDVLSVLTGSRAVMPMSAYAFLIVALSFNLAGRYTSAALLTLAMFPFVTAEAVLVGTEPRIAFTYLVIAVIASSILLERPVALTFDIGCFLFLLSLPLFIPERVPSWRSILGPLVLLAIGSGLSIILTIHRDEIERDRQAALRASEERLRLALDASRMGTWEWDSRLETMQWSERVDALFGLPPGGLESTSAAYFKGVHPEDRPALEKAFAEVVSGGSDDFEMLHRVVLENGAIRWLQIQGRSTERTGASRRVNGTVLDVTARHEAEAERDALIQELEQKNAELGRFTYTVSHDLKSPLITIRGFLGSIQSDVQAGRFDRLGADVDRILSATTRMQRLLDELMNLSRIGRVSNPHERIQFADLAQEAIALVRGRLDASKASVEINANLPDAYGDRSRLVQVLQNLLDNAAKFLGDQETPRIVVGSRPAATDGRPVFYVQDNGIGIEPSHHETVLGLFQKLDEKSDGTGAGLAIVKRIVEVHGGRLWVESKGKGQGTAICFTLPAPPRA